MTAPPRANSPNAATVGAAAPSERADNAGRLRRLAGRNAALVAERLAMACSAVEHTFWPDDVSLVASGLINWPGLLGHRQVTDAYLLALAVRNKGRLVTFDRRISTNVVVGASSEHLESIA